MLSSYEPLHTEIKLLTCDLRRTKLVCPSTRFDLGVCYLLKECLRSTHDNSEQRILISDCADAHADLSRGWSHIGPSIG